MAVYFRPFIVNVTAFRCWLLVRRTGVDPSPTSTALPAQNVSKKARGARGEGTPSCAKFNSGSRAQARSIGGFLARFS
jgi:hypothetical protein